jgi:D-cysteine desulfhydrase
MSNAAGHRSAFDSVVGKLGKETLATLPTPVREYKVSLEGRRATVFVKHDDLSAEVFGGNKVRKLEYLLCRARLRNRRLIATFGTVASNHALATSLYSRKLGLPCACFLSHQRNTPMASRVLNMHTKTGTELVPFGGAYPERLRILRDNLWGRDAGVIPPGGSSWLGAVGLVEAGIELARQIAADELPPPDRVYVATGTLGTAAGLALGFALMDLDAEIHAVRVSHTWVCNEHALRRLIGKTACMLRRLEPSIPADLDRRVNVHLRHEFFAGGYAATNSDVEAALCFAGDQLGLTLEGTYTGKAMAAIMSDLRRESRQRVLFWNTCNSRNLTVPAAAPLDRDALPGEFLRYFDHA